MAHLHARQIYRSALLSIRDVRCRPLHGGCGGEEATEAHTLVFARSGVFVLHVRGRQVVADAGHVVFFNRAEPYRVSHPVPGGDDCTSFSFAPDVLADALAEHGVAADRREAPFTRTHACLEPRAALRELRLRRQVWIPGAGRLAIEETALGLLHEALRAASPGSGAAPVLRRGAAGRRRDLVEAAKLVLARDPEADLTLDDVAAAVGCSPFHLTRLFRAMVGVPLHQYRLRRRVILALERLGGAADLSRLALELGFATHSHFTATFRRMVGLPPGAIRCWATGLAFRRRART